MIALCVAIAPSLTCVYLRCFGGRGDAVRLVETGWCSFDSQLRVVSGFVRTMGTGEVFAITLLISTVACHAKGEYCINRSLEIRSL